MLAFWTTVIGYVLLIGGSALLYFNSPRDIPIGRIPVLKGSESADFFRQQDEAITSRANWSRRGFGLLLLGSLCQLAAVVLTATRR